MSGKLGQDAASILAQCRRAGTLSQLPLHELSGRAAAEAFQAAAMRAFGGTVCGHKIGATSIEVQELLSCRQPIHAPVRRDDVLPSGSEFALPPGVLGIECEFGFQMARDFPLPGDIPERGALPAAIRECFMALEIVGRRVAGAAPLTEESAIADFALDVAVIRGDPIPDWERHALDAMEVRAVVDRVTVARGSGARVLGHPLNALLWLAQALHARGERLRAGEIILTGTCTGVARVAPGQSFAGCFADLPPVQVRLASCTTP